MNQESIMCPNCESANLNTAFIKFRAGEKRKTKQLPIKICRHCNFVIDKNGSMNYFINGNVI